MLKRNRAVAGFDRPHNLQFYGNYELPFGKGQQFAKTGPMAMLLGGWQTNWILSRISGTPFTVLTSGTSLNAPGNTQTADQILSNVAILGGHGVGQPYFDPNAFSADPNANLPSGVQPRFGSSGRNLLRGPGLFNLDASIFRTFKISERFGLQFRGEMFGVTNTPAFANPGATASAANRTLGVITKLNGYGEITSATGERQARFALKLTF